MEIFVLSYQKTLDSHIQVMLIPFHLQTVPHCKSAGLKERLLAGVQVIQ